MQPFPCRTSRAPALFLILGTLSAGAATAQVSVTTERYDNARTGANLAETKLTTTNVNQTQFGKLWTYAIDGAVYAQSLYVVNVAIPGQGTHNVLYVATMNDVVYAFDADSTALLWKRDLRNPAADIGPVPIVDILYNAADPNTQNIVGAIGIESTPVIDPAGGTLYLVARARESGSYVQRLHALDITTGAERAGSPVVIQGSVSGTGDGGSTVNFNPKTANQRASLALANGQVYIAWASHDDQLPWHGWVMSYDQTTLQRTGIFCVTPNGANGGIWMAGRAPAVDANGNVYYMVGNGDWDGSKNFGESFIKLGAPNAGQLQVSDYFTQYDWSSLEAPDLDLGSSGPLLIPGSSLIIGGGKQSQMYLTSTTSLGHLLPSNTQIKQTLAVNPPSYVEQFDIRAGGPAYWNRGSGGAGPWLYVWPDNDYLKAYHFNGSTFDTTPVSTTTSAQSGYGGVLTLSANGGTPGSGIVWASVPASGNGETGLLHGVLHAFNADNLSAELWNSDQNGQRDGMGYLPKFSPPIVANGRVYMASQSGYVSVYGLLPTAAYFTLTAYAPLTPPPSPAGQVDPGPVAVANPGGSVSYTIATSAQAGFSGSIALAIGGLPAGVTASWSSQTVAAGSSVTLTLHTTATTPVNSYPLTLSGTAGAAQVSTGAVLVVQPSRAIGLEFWDPSCTATGMNAVESAGVVHRPYWNSYEYAAQPAPASGGPLFTPAPLNDETGATTGAWASWQANGQSANPNIADNPGDDRMMHCYLDPAGGSATVTLSNLPANGGGYDVYVYADGNNGAASRTGTYQISGPGITTVSINVIDAAGTDFNGTFVRANNSAGNYAVFPLGPNVTGFTLTATPAGSSGAAPINGVQIVPDDIFRDGFE